MHWVLIHETGKGIRGWPGWSWDLIRIFRKYLTENVTFVRDLKEKRMNLENSREWSAEEMVPGRGFEAMIRLTNCLAEASE